MILLGSSLSRYPVTLTWITSTWLSVTVGENTVLASATQSNAHHDSSCWVAFCCAFYCMNITKLDYPFYCWWTLEIFKIRFFVLWIILTWTFSYVSFGTCMYAFLLGLYLVVKFLGNRRYINLTSGDNQTVSELVTPFYISISSKGLSFAPHSHQHFVLVVFNFDFPVDIYWYHIMVFTCISQISRELDCLSSAYWQLAIGHCSLSSDYVYCTFFYSYISYWFTRVFYIF